MYNSNTFIFLFLFLGFCRVSSNNEGTGFFIFVGDGTNAELIVKGENTFNSNGDNGIRPFLNSNSNLEINVETGSTLNSCGNGADIRGFVSEGAKVDFSGTGYTCDQDKVEFTGDGAGNVVPPKCQACPSA